jgi:competence protein ComEC
MSLWKKSWLSWVPPLNVSRQKRNRKTACMSKSLIENNTDSFSDRIYYRPLIPLLIAFISGIAAANFLSEQIICPAVAGILVSAGVLIFSIANHKEAKLLPLFLFFCLGYYALTPWLPTSFSEDHVKYYMNDPIQWEISGIIDDPPLSQDYRTVCILNQIRLSRPGKGDRTIPVRGKIRAIIYGNSDALTIGDRLIFESRIRPFTNFENPGGFDYVKYMTFKQIWGNAYTSYQKMTVDPSAKNVRRHLSSIRQKISTLINQSSDNEANFILKALILGNRQQISKPLNEAFNRAGISHLLAISGLHIGIVASFAFLLFTTLFTWFNLFLQHAWTRKSASVLALFPVLLYGIIAGMSPSTQRAVIMVGVFLLTFLIEREHDLLNTVSVAALIILIISPPSLFSISFQLSFAAVLAITYGTSRILQSKEKPANTMSSMMIKVYTFIIVSGLAIIGTAPLTMFYFNQISLTGIFSNLIFIPIIGFVVVPLGLFSVLILMPVSSDAAVWGLKICDFILTFSIEWVYRLSELPYAAVKTITPSVIEIICAYVLLGSALYLFFPNTDPSLNTKGKNETRNGEKGLIQANTKLVLNRSLQAKNSLPCRIYHEFEKIIKYSLSGRQWALILTGITFFVLSADISYWIGKRWGKDDLTVSILDVGQGNAALIEMPGGRCALIDGGGYSDNEIFDIGEKVIAPFLWHKKIKTIETVILTHYDSDHLNGLIFILKNFNVRQVLANHDPATCFKNKEFNHIVQTHQIHYPPYRGFPKKLNINGVTLKILYPIENFADLAVNDSWRDSNNNSMVVQVNFDNQSILFPGDIMQKAEEELTDLNEDLQSTVMVAPHHGSDTSSSPIFLKQVNPEYIIVSAGSQNRFGFPDSDVLQRYEKNGIITYRTDVSGGICISYDNEGLTLKPMKGTKIRIDH